VSDRSPAIAGVQKCGCITYVNAEPDHLNRDDEKALAKVIRNGGSVRRATVGELRDDPNFLNSECPHDPKGWERQIWEPRARTRRSLGIAGKLLVEVEVSKLGVWRLAGEIRKATDGSWMATPGYFERGKDSDTLGPFRLQREAKEALIKPAVDSYESRVNR
jgi:hypothetical protein